MNKKGQEKLIYAFVIGILIGAMVGTGGTYAVMRNNEKNQATEYENEKLSITEKLQLEITKLGLRNTTYRLVDDIESRISKINEGDKKLESGIYLLGENNTYYLANEETLELIPDSLPINIEEYKTDKIPTGKSMVIITDKGKISEAVFYIDTFQITYDLIGTKITDVTQEK